jgi:hypothetical protein
MTGDIDRNGVPSDGMRAVRARLFALLAALVMLLPSGASARTQFYCRMMGHIVATSSCDNRSASEPASRAQEFQLADCCQRLSSSSRNAVLGTLDAVHHVAPAALVATVPQFFAAGPLSDSGSGRVEPTHSPLAIGPPLFIANCALLS